MKDIIYEGKPLVMYHQLCHACNRTYLAPYIERVCFMCSTNTYKQPEGWFK